MSKLAWVAWIGIGIWLLLTLIYQHSTYGAVVARFDIFRLLPRWTFFAPNPGVADYHLIVRDRDSAEKPGKWRAVEFAKDRHYSNILWNPQKRPKKILSDAVQLLKAISRSSAAGVASDSLSIPYLLLLKYSLEVLPLGEDMGARQFGIVESTGHASRATNIIYLSLFHPR